jgi:hypothetical protein
MKGYIKAMKAGIYFLIAAYAVTGLIEYNIPVNNQVCIGNLTLCGAPSNLTVNWIFAGNTNLSLGSVTLPLWYNQTGNITSNASIAGGNVLISGNLTVSQKTSIPWLNVTNIINNAFVINRNGVLNYSEYVTYSQYQQSGDVYNTPILTVNNQGAAGGIGGGKAVIGDLIIENSAPVGGAFDYSPVLRVNGNGFITYMGGMIVRDDIYTMTPGYMGFWNENTQDFGGYIQLVGQVLESHAYDGIKSCSGSDHCLTVNESGTWYWNGTHTNKLP